MFDLEDELERRTLTYTEWNQSATKMEGQAWHPITFKYTNASPQRINKLKVNYTINSCHLITFFFLNDMPSDYLIQ